MIDFKGLDRNDDTVCLKEFKCYMEFIGFDTSDAHDQKWEQVFK